MSAKSKSTKQPKTAKVFALVTESGLTKEEMAAAQRIADCSVEAVRAYEAFKSVENEGVARFWELCDALRTPVVLPPHLKGVAGQDLPPAAMNGREITLLLLGLGEPKQRVTEWKRICTMPVEQYNQVRKLSLSKVQALGVARGTLKIEGEEVVSAKPETKTPERVTPTKAEYHKLSERAKVTLHELIQDAQEIKATNDDVPYQFEGTTVDGRKYVINIFVDQLPVKAQ